MTGHPLEALSALLDGELPEPQRREVEAHLADCAACARHLEELKALDTLARGMPPVAVPDGYLEALPGRVRARIRADRPASTARAPWVWPLAAGLALAVLAPLVLRDGPSPQKQAAQDYERPAEAPAQPTTPTPVPEAAPSAQTEHDQSRSAQALRRAAAPEAKARQDAPRGGVIGGLAGEPAAKAASPRERSEAPATEDMSADARVMRDEAPAASTFAHEPAAGVAPPPPPPPPPAAPPFAVAPTGAARKSEAGNAIRTGEERAFFTASRLPITTAASARSARAAWLRFLADHPSGARADEARVRLVEASVSLFRATGDDDDRLAAERDAAAYLSSPGAPQAARVRDALLRLAEPR